MTNSFEVALSKSVIREIKEKELENILLSTDKLCSYINYFLPKQLTSYGDDNQASSDEEESPNENKHFGSTSRAKTIEELHKRIEKLRGKKANYKEKLLKKGLKNRLKKKQKLEERKQQKNAARKQEGLPQKSAEEITNIKTENVPDSSLHSQKPSIQFNKLVVRPDENENKNKLSDPKRLLQQIEKKNQKLHKLEAKGKTEKVKEIKAKETWESVIKKAEGVKVKDDVELLKKSISKVQQRKNKSKKKWEQREQTVKSKKEEAQKKRRENIEKKKKERQKKRTKVLIKKGRILPK